MIQLHRLGAEVIFQILEHIICITILHTWVSMVM